MRGSAGSEIYSSRARTCGLKLAKERNRHGMICLTGLAVMRVRTRGKGLRRLPALGTIMTSWCQLLTSGRVMVRVTLRLPEDLHRRLRAVSQRTGTSLNQLVVAVLGQAVARDDGATEDESYLKEQVNHIRTALGDLAVELDTDQLPSHLRPGEDLPDRAVFARTLPKLSPPLSATIIADREESF